MTTAERVRRIAVWTVAAASFAVAILALLIVGDLFVLAGWSAFAIMGALILTHRRGNAIGRVMLATAALWATTDGCFVLIAVLAGSAAPWLMIALSATANLAGILGFLCLILLVIVFPSGRIMTAGGRVILSLLAALALYALVLCVITPLPPTGELGQPWLLVALGSSAPPDGIISNLAVPLLITAALVELSFRWRRSDADERLQFRWFAFGCVIVIAVVVADTLWQVLVPDSHGSAQEVAWLVILPFNAIPISVGLAVLRYRLYEIDRVLSRTVSYAIVTLVAVGVYALVVTSATWLVPQLPSVGVAAATLAAAAAFLPLLHAVRHRIDRRFDRERYDAEHVVDAFGERLRTRVDPGTTTDDLVSVVDAALQPESVGLWRAEATR